MLSLSLPCMGNPTPCTASNILCSHLVHHSPLPSVPLSPQSQVCSLSVIWNANGLQIRFLCSKDSGSPTASSPTSLNRPRYAETAFTISPKAVKVRKGRLKRHEGKGTSKYQYIIQVCSEFWDPELHLDLQHKREPSQFEQEIQLFQIFASGKGSGQKTT